MTSPGTPIFYDLFLSSELSVADPNATPPVVSGLPQLCVYTEIVIRLLVEPVS